MIQQSLREQIIKNINSLDWSQSEFGHMPSDDDIASEAIKAFQSVIPSKRVEQSTSSGITAVYDRNIGYNEAIKLIKSRIEE